MKRLILLRHAHRDTQTGRLLDNGLSDKGRLQTRFITEKLVPKLDPKSTGLLTSPAKRCLETIAPLSDALSLPFLIDESLFEQHPKETNLQFLQRIREKNLILSATEHKNILICSHGDWIPLALSEWVGSAIWVKKGRWCELKFNKNKVQRVSLQIEMHYP